MKKQALVILTVIFGASMMFAFMNCSGSSNPSASSNSSVTTYSAVTMTSFQSCTWTSSCQAGPDSTWFQEVLDATGEAPANTILYWRVYNDQNCTSTDMAFEIQANTNITLGSQVASAGDATSFQMQTPTSYSVGPATATVAGLFNEEKVCGLTSWTDSSWETISASNSCVTNLLSSNPIPNSGIMAISNETLYFGSGSATTVNTSLPFTPSCTN